MQSEPHEISLNTTCAAEPNLWATFVSITIPLEELLNAIWIIALISELCPWVSTAPFPRAGKMKPLALSDWPKKNRLNVLFHGGYPIKIFHNNKAKGLDMKLECTVYTVNSDSLKPFKWCPGEFQNRRCMLNTATKKKICMVDLKPFHIQSNNLCGEK